MQKDRRHTGIYRLVILLAMLPAMLVAIAQQPRMTIKAEADSTTLIMGDRVAINLEVVKNSHQGALIGLPEIHQDYHGLELSEVTADSTDLGNGRTQLNYRLVFQAFTPAELLVLPGFAYASQGDTVVSDIVTFKVFPVDIPEELGSIEDVESLTINPDVPPVEVKSHLFDWVTDWMIWTLVTALIVAALIVCYILYRKNGPRIFYAPKPIPPYEVAIGRLNKMREDGMIEHSQPKEFFTTITDIFRTYLQGRFGIPALEMTTRQILGDLRKNKETHLSADQMEQLLQVSDFVKFAAMDPTADERVRTYKTIYSFVESTKPVDPEVETATQKDKVTGDETANDTTTNP